jgi:hypothetical protein
MAADDQMMIGDWVAEHVMETQAELGEGGQIAIISPRGKIEAIMLAISHPCQGIDFYYKESQTRWLSCDVIYFDESFLIHSTILRNVVAPHFAVDGFRGAFKINDGVITRYP